ncbi:hypothetical protein EI94DRAFT_1051873 [Lactarius quietus]|nr:hypothetical protein EI94DRAFT_1051873 [Lactarius quietus]
MEHNKNVAQARSDMKERLRASAARQMGKTAVREHASRQDPRKKRLRFRKIPLSLNKLRGLIWKIFWINCSTDNTLRHFLSPHIFFYDVVHFTIDIFSSSTQRFPRLRTQHMDVIFIEDRSLRHGLCSLCNENRLALGWRCSQSTSQSRARY